MVSKYIVVASVIGVAFLLLFSGKPKQEPTMQQWGNRLIEYFEPWKTEEVFEQFLALVEQGLDPAHAFEMVVKYD